MFGWRVIRSFSSVSSLVVSFLLTLFSPPPLISSGSSSSLAPVLPVSLLLFGGLSSSSTVSSISSSPSISFVLVLTSFLAPHPLLAISSLSSSRLRWISSPPGSLVSSSSSTPTLLALLLVCSLPTSISVLSPFPLSRSPLHICLGIRWCLLPALFASSLGSASLVCAILLLLSAVLVLLPCSLSSFVRSGVSFSLPPSSSLSLLLSSSLNRLLSSDHPGSLPRPLLSSIISLSSAFSLPRSLARAFLPPSSPPPSPSLFFPSLLSPSPLSSSSSLLGPPPSSPLSSLLSAPPLLILLPPSLSLVLIPLSLQSPLRLSVSSSHRMLGLLPLPPPLIHQISPSLLLATQPPSILRAPHLSSSSSSPASNSLLFDSRAGPSVLRHSHPLILDSLHPHHLAPSVSDPQASRRLPSSSPHYVLAPHPSPSPAHSSLLVDVALVQLLSRPIPPTPACEIPPSLLLLSRLAPATGSIALLPSFTLRSLSSVFSLALSLRLSTVSPAPGSVLSPSYMSSCALSPLSRFDPKQATDFGSPRASDNPNLGPPHPSA
uniref:Uncharacterized protein n=1 Tax=Knipowitschia caucasica TaxID=637954 RepID=A0AAV2K5H8_KNICA